ncbi:putative LysM domain-containing protein [Dioscorea sansibarensis]
MATKAMAKLLAIADMVSLSCSLLMIALILVTAMHESLEMETMIGDAVVGKGRLINDRVCDEIYVVGEGETLQTISDKCGDPFIVERNPHVHDPDDVFPGLVIALRPTKLRP